MSVRFQSVLIPGVVMMALAGCWQSDYTRTVKREMASGIRHDSVMLGIRFGDSNHDFYGRCFDLNKAGLLTQGTGSSVRYVLTDSINHSLKAPLEIEFYPTFDQRNKIAELRLKFAYIGWTSWNKSLHSDSLKVRVMALMKEWYNGNDFIFAKLDTVQVPVKVDGNRRIIVTVLDAAQVEVQIQDIMNPMFKHSIYREEEQEKTGQ